MIGNTTIKKELSIIFGGRSPEHVASVESFRFVYESICESKNDLCLYSIYFVDKKNRVFKNKFNEHFAANDYIERGQPMSYSLALENMSNEGVYVFNLLHGNYGEDGHIQGAAAVASLRGSFGAVLPASLAMSKSHMNHYIASAHPTLKIPHSLTIRDQAYDSAIEQIRRTFEGETIVVKPNSLGASLFTEKYVVSDACVPDLEKNLALIFKYDQLALIQSFVRGMEYSIGCIQRSMSPIALPAVEIRTGSQFFGHSEKHCAGMAEEIIVEPDTLTTRILRKVSTQIFEDLGFANMCRFDFIASEHGDLYFLEANPIPGLMRNSIFPKMLRAFNIDIPDLMGEFIDNDTQIKPKNMIFDYKID
jgi:D-alanine-D-alanine ligase